MTFGRLSDLVKPEVNPSTKYANPENYLSTKHVDSALLATGILKLSQLKAAILCPASKLYSLGTVGNHPIQNLAPMSYASTVT